MSQARNDAEDLDAEELDEEFAEDEPQDAAEEKATKADRRSRRDRKDDKRPSRGKKPAAKKSTGPAAKKPAAKKRKRTSPALFYRQIVAEMRKVVWPTRAELSTYTAVVIVFVVCIIGIVAAMDYGISKAVQAVFG
ncbi:MAG TPA: preprotein translocase subunit SecE [Actinocrinis sp.]|nr:preprotein translocase subunit SecE [Actinocrinis sp.]